MLKLRKHRTKKHKYARREFPESYFIPYKYLWNENTLLLKNDSLMQVIRIGGFSFETADDEDVDSRKNIRNLLLKGIGAGSISLYFHVIRRKENTFARVSENHDKEMPDLFSRCLEDEWRKKHEFQKNYINEIYISIVKSRSAHGLAAVEDLIQRLQEKADPKLWEIMIRESFNELDEMSSRILTTLRDYKPKLLGTVETKQGVYSEVLEFLGKLVNCGLSTAMQVPNMPVCNYLPTNRLYFGKRAVEVKGHTSSRFAGLISIKEYSQQTSSAMMDGFLQMPFELIITQSFGFIDRQNAINKMKIQQNRMISSQDVAVSQIHEISAALDDAMSGRIGFGRHHLTVLCIEDTPKSLENVLAMAMTELSNSGIIPVREKVNLEPAYWAQLPGNESFAIRRATINTLNLSGFASMHNYPIGQEKGNHWGDYVTVLDTTSGTPFFFNFHVRDVGHTTIIGPTGAGKTVLMNFLCAQARKFGCRMFFFDKDRGAEIFIRAIGGKYIAINPGEGCGFNPLQLPDTSENRTFLTDWFKLMVTVNGEKVSATDTERISDAVVGSYKLDKKDRVLSNIVPFLGIGGPDTLAGRIAMWHGNGSHAKVFDNTDDVIDFTTNKVFGFEMGDLLRDTASLGPVLLYIFHRINISLDGTASMIVLDEAWALIDNDVFAPKIKDWLKVLRKLNCFVIFATQSVEDASKSKISDTLIQQTATQIFLPNLKATDVYRSHFMLSQREFTLIKTTDPGTRFFLVKQAMDAVVARVDLSGMDKVISVLSGRAETVVLLHNIMEQHGEDPEVWLPIFWEKVKEI